MGIYSSSHTQAQYYAIPLLYIKIINVCVWINKQLKCEYEFKNI